MAKDFVSAPLTKLGENISTDLYGAVKKWFAKLDPGGMKLRDYHEGLLTSFGHVQIMGMASPRKLQNIYVGLRAAPEMKKYTLSTDEYKPKPEQERNIVEARKLLYGRESVNIDKFMSEIGFEGSRPLQITIFYQKRTKLIMIQMQ